MGCTEMDTPWLNISQRNGSPADVSDGGASKDGKVWGCYIHGYSRMMVSVMPG